MAYFRAFLRHFAALLLKFGAFRSIWGTFVAHFLENVEYFLAFLSTFQVFWEVLFGSLWVIVGYCLMPIGQLCDSFRLGGLLGVFLGILRRFSRHS